MNYILKDSDRYYISEGKATMTRSKATTFNTLEDIFKLVPIMRDWNWDYKIFKIEDDKIILVKEENWSKLYYSMKEQNLLYEQNNKVITAFIRTTIQ